MEGLVTRLITNNKVLEKILGLKENKSAGPCDLHPNVLKEDTVEIVEPLVGILQKASSSKREALETMGLLKIEHIGFQILSRKEHCFLSAF